MQVQILPHAIIFWQAEGGMLRLAMESFVRRRLAIHFGSVWPATLVRNGEDKTVILTIKTMGLH